MLVRLGVAIVWALGALAAPSAAVPPTAITVTTTADAVNGNVSSVAALLESPGSDGISLREAIVATNGDPGSHAVTFARTLRGKAIAVRSQLPLLTGGGLTIDGDVNGDGRPDVTIRSVGPKGDEPTGLWIASSGNRLTALTLEGFAIGVRLQPTGFRRTLADNEVRSLVMRNLSAAGIYLDSYGRPACGAPKPRSCPSFNRWLRTTLADNTIESRGEHGIGVALQNSIGDRVEEITMTGNTIRTPAQGSIGIDLSAGFWIASTRNRLSGVLIARNAVESAGAGIRVYAGEAGAQANTVEGVRILDNRLRLTRRGSAFCCGGISVGLADEATHMIEPKLRPIRYPDRNLLRNVEIAGNTVSGTLVVGVEVMICCEGGSHNRIQGIRVVRNVIRSSTPGAGVELVAGDSATEEGLGTDNRIFDVRIDRNRIAVGNGEQSRWPPEQVGGVVVVAGGLFTRSNLVSGIRITNNSIDTTHIGIRVVGGIGNARGNAVRCVRVAGNRISGTRLPISVQSNVGGASGNRATLDGC